MLKEIILITIIIITIITLNNISLGYTNENFDNISNKLENLKEELRNENNISSKQVLNSINIVNEKWEQIHDRLSYYIEHDELEKIEISITRTKSYINQKNYKESLVEIEKCLFLLQHIKNRETVCLNNIF